MYTSLLLLSVQCIQVFFVCSDATDRATRGLSMLRMGKRNLGLLRPSRSFSLPPLVPSSYDLPEDIEERQLIGSPRMGKNLDDYEIPRYESAVAPPYPRLGAYDEYVNEIRRALSSPDDEIRQIYASIPRAGRYLGRQKRSVDALQPVDAETEEQMNIDEATSEHKEKRALPRFGLRDTEDIPFPRLGLYNRDSPFPRLGLYERSSIFPRLGLRDEDEARSVTVPRLGLRDSDENEIEAEERALPRFGLRNIDEKRAMSMLRMGKREDEISNEKRAMSMLRMGKRGHMSMLRMGKRGMSMLRMGRSQPIAEEEGNEEQKRAVSMLRMGRSLENDEATSEEEQKRAMSMLRMGKRGHMSMLRMGRSYEDDASNKRAVGMLRMGRGMSMLRMGKRSSLEEQEAEADKKRAMSMLRMGRGMSMLRMGKRDVDEQEEEAMKVVADQDNTEVEAEG